MLDMRFPLWMEIPVLVIQSASQPASYAGYVDDSFTLLRSVHFFNLIFLVLSIIIMLFVLFDRVKEYLCSARHLVIKLHIHTMYVEVELVLNCAPVYHCASLLCTLYFVRKFQMFSFTEYYSIHSNFRPATYVGLFVILCTNTWETRVL